MGFSSRPTAILVGFLLLQGCNGSPDCSDVWAEGWWDFTFTDSRCSLLDSTMEVLLTAFSEEHWCYLEAEGTFVNDYFTGTYSATYLHASDNIDFGFQFGGDQFLVTTPPGTFEFTDSQATGVLSDGRGTGIWNMGFWTSSEQLQEDVSADSCYEETALEYYSNSLASGNWTASQR